MLSGIPDLVSSMPSTIQSAKSVQGSPLSRAEVQSRVQVSEEDAKKALNEQYGGEDASTPGTGLNHFKFTKYSNAYMLVYVRKSDWDQVNALYIMSSQCPSLTHLAQMTLLPLHGTISRIGPQRLCSSWMAQVSLHASWCSNRAFPAEKSMGSGPQHHIVLLTHISRHTSMTLGVHGPYVPHDRDQEPVPATDAGASALVVIVLPSYTKPCFLERPGA